MCVCVCVCTRACLQTDLEMVTEDLAQKVNRPYLRTPRLRIIRAACLVQQKRQEFLASVARGVAPNDSPDIPRRRWVCSTQYPEHHVLASKRHSRFSTCAKIVFLMISHW